MEDAPKDGSNILVARNNDLFWEYDVVYYDDSFGDQYPWRRTANINDGYPVGRLDFWQPLEPPYPIITE